MQRNKQQSNYRFDMLEKLSQLNLTITNAGRSLVLLAAWTKQYSVGSHFSTSA